MSISEALTVPLKFMASCSVLLYLSEKVNVRFALSPATADSVSASCGVSWPHFRPLDEYLRGHDKFVFDHDIVSALIQNCMLSVIC